MANNDRRPFPGWEYREEYAPVFDLVLDTHPGIATALSEAQRAYREEMEVATTATLHEYPTEEEQLAYFTRKYHLP